AGNKERPPPPLRRLNDGESRSGIAPAAAAQQAREEKVPVFTVALASQPPPELEQIAEISGGQAFTAPTSEQLTAVYRDLGTRLTYVEEKRELTSYFMAGAAILLLAGAAASKRLFFPPPRPPPGTPSTLELSSEDPAGLRALLREDDPALDLAGERGREG